MGHDAAESIQRASIQLATSMQAMALSLQEAAKAIGRVGGAAAGIGVTCWLRYHVRTPEGYVPPGRLAEPPDGP